LVIRHPQIPAAEAYAVIVVCADINGWHVNDSPTSALSDSRKRPIRVRTMVLKPQVFFDRDTLEQILKFLNVLRRPETSLDIEKRRLPSIAGGQKVRNRTKN
jgi:hypothetical protein